MSSRVLCVEVSEAFLALNTVLASTACFIIAVLAMGWWTHHHGPISAAARAMRWHNQIYAAASLVMFALIVQFSTGNYNEYGCMTPVAGDVKRSGATSSSPIHGNHLSFAQSAVKNNKQTTLIALAPLLYYCSKFYEYLDIILVLANHGPNYNSLSQQPISLHFGLHHLTTPYLTWFRIIQSTSPGWEVFAGLNCLHHAIMYAFFGGVKIVVLEPRMMRKVLPWTGGLQLIAGIGMEVKSLMVGADDVVAESSRDELRSHWIALGLLSTYLLLYVRDLRQRKDEKATKI